ncbi:DUF2808 domain-containing protein [Candidatus Synechococcus calcipolaris G9]|uniref:DUF2808 domain-containing protein n=1 Tax=Candidatus Synechococcus calcipolaris G9 TaxID=1497997 RepID=A0ABT6F1J1_9SYNE|nr:DUF2808 domain-containing protein [Candidatus Synechococcus calcipolaris]MDG2991651.1 DUF2808 domain-containing protein [Candidatus Synechococcus calcipolaris G9]
MVRVQRLLPAMFAAGCLVASGMPLVAQAQSNPGFTFNWGDGPSGSQQLRYHLDYGTPGFLGDRYWLRLGNQKVAINRINISYPDYFDGTFNAQSIELRTGGSKSNSFFQFRRDPGKLIELAEVTLDRDNRTIDIVPAEVIPAGTEVQVIMSNVRNPRSSGMFYFNARIGSPGDVPLMRYIGTWIISIARP